MNALEVIGRELLKESPEHSRLNLQLINILVALNHAQLEAPEIFEEAYRAIMLRPFQERIPSEHEP